MSPEPAVLSSVARPAGGAAQYLTFTLNDEAYAVDIFHVTEILEYRHLTAVPMMPEFVRGVINLRGRAVPVVDLAGRFARGTTTVSRRTSIIIVHAGTGGGRDAGILVDTVNKVVEFGAGDIEPVPTLGAGPRAEYVAGMARRGDDFTIVLDVDQVLACDELAATVDAPEV